MSDPPSSGVLALRILDVSVEVRCEDPATLERLRACYEPCLAPRFGSPDVAVELLAEILAADGDSARVRVPGRGEFVEQGTTAAVRRLNHELLHALMLRRPELYYVHAAVLDVGGAGLVLAGPSGAGKSTLALALVLAGAGLLSDELLAWDGAARRARPFPRALKIRDACLPAFPNLTGAFVGEGEGRFLLAARLPRRAPAGAVPVRLVVFPRWSPEGADALEDLSPGAGVLELARSSLNFGTHRAASLDELAGLVRDATCHRLEWRDPHRAAAALLARAGAGGARSSGVRS